MVSTPEIDGTRLLAPQLQIIRRPPALPSPEDLPYMQKMAKQDPGELYYEFTRSICPLCKAVIDADIIFRKNRVFMKKRCPTHGFFETNIFNDAEFYMASLQRNKPGTIPANHQTRIEDGCPWDCGLCEDHKQHTCSAVLEVNDRCNLACEVCFANIANRWELSLDRMKAMIDVLVHCEEPPEVLQLSGGEPTLHPDLNAVIDYAYSVGVKFVVVNTNGLKLCDADFMKEFARERDTPSGKQKKPYIFLQFDGVSDSIYERLRGRPLAALKMRAIETCGENGIVVALVPTIIQGVNDQEIGKICEVAMAYQHVKMVNFQPATFSGRYDIDYHNHENSPANRITLPDVMRAVEDQTGGLIRFEDFVTVPCPSPLTSTTTYIYKDSKIPGADAIVIPRIVNMDDYMEFLSNQSLPTPDAESEKIIANIDKLLSASALMGTSQTDDALCNACGISIPQIKGMLDDVTLITNHCFMDEYNFDVKRAKKCCITELTPDGNMIPFCNYNIFYRDQMMEHYPGLYPYDEEIPEGGLNLIRDPVVMSNRD